MQASLLRMKSQIVLISCELIHGTCVGKSIDERTFKNSSVFIRLNRAFQPQNMHQRHFHTNYNLVGCFIKTLLMSKLTFLNGMNLLSSASPELDQISVT